MRKCRREQIAGRYFTPDEQEYATAMGEAGFFQIWTRKEAYVKFTGEGINEKMKDVSTLRSNEVDLAAPLSTKVKAIAEGTVTKVSEDDRYGMTVEINHGNGIISTYSNLAEQGLAEMGDVVQQGQIIGAVGETALFEIMEESHLHLEMTKDSAYVNPVDYIKGL